MRIFFSLKLEFTFEVQNLQRFQMKNSPLDAQFENEYTDTSAASVQPSASPVFRYGGLFPCIGRRGIKKGV